VKANVDRSAVDAPSSRVGAPRLLLLSGSPLAWLLIVSLVARVIIVFVVGTPTPEHQAVYEDANRYDTLAWHMAQGRGFVNAFGVPEAKDPPLLPAVLAPVYLVFGHNYQVARVFFIIVGLLTVVALYWLTRALFGPRVALATGVIAALYPDLVSYSGLTMTESVYIPALLAAMIAFIRGLETNRPLMFAGAGAFIGLAALARPEAAPASVVLALVVVLLPLSGLRVRLRNSAIIVGTALVVLLPWTARNAVQFHAFLPVSTGAGVGLYVGSYLPWSGLDARAGQSIYTQPFYSRLTSGRDEIGQDHVLLAQAARQIRQHPLGYARLLPRKFFVLFRNSDSNGIYGAANESHVAKALLELIYVAVLTAIVVGLISVARRRSVIELAYLTIPAYLTVVHVLTIPAARYAFPIILLLLPLAGLGLISIIDRRAGRASTART